MEIIKQNLARRIASEIVHSEATVTEDKFASTLHFNFYVLTPDELDALVAERARLLYDFPVVPDFPDFKEGS